MTLPLSFSSGRYRLGVAAVLLVLMSTPGCKLWDKDSWNLARYRDERAVEIETRLERNEPIVKNPF